MPIGKDSLKRVANNGYSKVATSAPDMENSTVIANPSEQVIDKMIPSVKKTGEAKKPTQNKSAQQKTGARATPKKTGAKAASGKKGAAGTKVIATEKQPDVSENKKINNEREGDGYVNLGGTLPVHLL